MSARILGIELRHPETIRAWETLRGLPAREQRTRVVTLREAALSCDGRDLLEILVGKGGHR